MDVCKVYEYFNRNAEFGGITGHNSDSGGSDTGDDNSGNSGDSSSGGDGIGQDPSPNKLSASDLSSMTVSAIKELAAEKGYVLNSNKKADIINEFISLQG